METQVLRSKARIFSVFTGIMDLPINGHETVDKTILGSIYMSLTP